METWKDIPGYEGLYQASTLGRVKSLHRNPHGKIMKPSPDSKGYLALDLRRNGTRRHAKVHQLVAWTFIGEQLDGMTINHKDMDKTNNRVENLEYMTKAENVRHAFKNMELLGLSKLTTTEVIRLVKKRNVDKSKLSELAVEFGVSKSTVSEIASGKRYRHVARTHPKVYES